MITLSDFLGNTVEEKIFDNGVLSLWSIFEVGKDRVTYYVLDKSDDDVSEKVTLKRAVEILNRKMKK